MNLSTKTIEYTRTLPIPPEYARHYAQYVASQLSDELKLAWTWASDTVISFTVPEGLIQGVNGSLTINGNAFTLRVELPLMLAMMEPLVRVKIAERFDEVEKMALSAAKAANAG